MMSDAQIWIGYGLPAMGVGLGLIGLAIAWLGARRFDRQFGKEPAATESMHGRRLSPYRKPRPASSPRKPRRNAAARL